MICALWDNKGTVLAKFSRTIVIHFPSQYVLDLLKKNFCLCDQCVMVFLEIFLYFKWLIGLLIQNPICKTEKETQMYRTDFWTLWEKMRVGCSERIALKQVYYQSTGEFSTPSTRLDAWDKCSGLVHWEDPEGWGGRQEWGSGWGTHVNPWLIHVNLWQKPLQYNIVR